jgi:hypothetical protein
MDTLVESREALEATTLQAVPGLLEGLPPFASSHILPHHYFEVHDKLSRQARLPAFSLLVRHHPISLHDSAARPTYSTVVDRRHLLLFFGRQFLLCSVVGSAGDDKRTPSIRTTELLTESCMQKGTVTPLTRQSQVVIFMMGWRSCHHRQSTQLIQRSTKPKIHPSPCSPIIVSLRPCSCLSLRS